MLAETYLTMDAKRRIAIPTKCRKKTGIAVVLTRNLDGCLDVYPIKMWESGGTKVQQLAKRLSISKKHRKLTRFLTTAERLDLDSSGRIVVPEHLAEIAELESSIVFVGTEEGFQLWSEDRWNSDGMPSVEEAQALAESEEFQRLSDVS
ncbi:MAG: division/cell wall cluster transcriptional repressor MraZ [Candidatus Kaiserbacteria bacterium]|nr:division/cell wall cluster transcriptional repressor MraZ [Candidatus Kaiserbacteria bacterium]